jgi:hypothetical protein
MIKTAFTVSNIPVKPTDARYVYYLLAANYIGRSIQGIHNVMATFEGNECTFHSADKDQRDDVESQNYVKVWFRPLVAVTPIEEYSPEEYGDLFLKKVSSAQCYAMTKFITPLFGLETIDVIPNRNLRYVIERAACCGQKTTWCTLLEEDHLIGSESIRMYLPDGQYSWAKKIHGSNPFEIYRGSRGMRDRYLSGPATERYIRQQSDTYGRRVVKSPFIPYNEKEFIP